MSQKLFGNNFKILKDNLMKVLCKVIMKKVIKDIFLKLKFMLCTCYLRQALNNK